MLLYTGVSMHHRDRVPLTLLEKPLERECRVEWDFQFSFLEGSCTGFHSSCTILYFHHSEEGALSSPQLQGMCLHSNLQKCPPRSRGAGDETPNAFSLNFSLIKVGHTQTRGQHTACMEDGGSHPCCFQEKNNSPHSAANLHAECV